nr:hypothetical protein Iba_chr04eCG6200 [Ipomoea batatas]
MRALFRAPAFAVARFGCCLKLWCERHVVSVGWDYGVTAFSRLFVSSASDSMRCQARVFHRLVASRLEDSGGFEFSRKKSVLYMYQMFVNARSMLFRVSTKSRFGYADSASPKDVSRFWSFAEMRIVLELGISVFCAPHVEYLGSAISAFCGTDPGRMIFDQE